MASIFKAPVADDAPPPKKWWQWLALYPALGVALLTALPQWFDRGLAVYHNVSASSYAQAEEESAMWHKNLSCAAAPFAWYSNPNNVRVDATICKSGDVFVRASTPDNKQHFKWIDLESLLKLKAKGGSIIPAAQAQSMSPALLSRADPRLLPAQFQNAVVICQRFLDDRRLLRHIRTSEGCFGDIVDTMNGTVVQHTPTACRTQC